MGGRSVRIGCSGWNYADWRGRVYPAGLPPRRWLAHYATLFDTVEVNSHLLPPRPPRGGGRAGSSETPPDFVFAVKASRYLTHMKRLTDMERGVERLYAGIAPLVASPKLGPGAVAAAGELPPRRRPARLRARAAPARPPRLRVPPPELVRGEVYGLLHTHGVALVHGDDPRRPLPPLALTTDWTLIRFHYGRARAPRQLLRDASCARGPAASASCARRPMCSPTSTTTGRASPCATGAGSRACWRLEPPSLRC